MNTYETLLQAIKEHSSLDNDEIIQAGEHGADAGWGGFCYTGDCCRFYQANKESIWELLNECAEDQGEHPMTLVASFGRKDMATSADGFENLLAWFALESVGQWLADQPASVRDEQTA